MTATRRFKRSLPHWAAAGALLAYAVTAGAAPARAQSWEVCVEAIANTQNELKSVLPKSKKPQAQQQSVAAQDSHQPTPGSLAAAGLEAPTTGPEAALNEAQNLQAAGDEAGCMKAVAKARSLAGLK